MWELSDILAQLIYGYELRPVSSEGDSFDVAHLLSVAFFLAVLTSMGLVPSLADWVRSHRQPRRSHLLRQERRVVQWWRHQHPGAFARSSGAREPKHALPRKSGCPYDERG